MYRLSKVMESKSSPNLLCDFWWMNPLNRSQSSYQQNKYLLTALECFTDYDNCLLILVSSPIREIQAHKC